MSAPQYWFCVSAMSTAFLLLASTPALVAIQAAIAVLSFGFGLCRLVEVAVDRLKSGATP